MLAALAHGWRDPHKANNTSDSKRNLPSSGKETPWWIVLVKLGCAVVAVKTSRHTERVLGPRISTSHLRLYDEEKGTNNYDDFLPLLDVDNRLISILCSNSSISLSNLIKSLVKTMSCSASPLDRAQLI